MRATSVPKECAASTAGVLIHQYLASLPGGLLKRNGNVYTQVVKNCSKKELEPLILKHTGLGTVYSDNDGLVNYKVKEHHRINHGADEFASNHINRELLGLY